MYIKISIILLTFVAFIYFIGWIMACLKAKDVLDESVKKKQEISCTLGADTYRKSIENSILKQEEIKIDFNKCLSNYKSIIATKDANSADKIMKECKNIAHELNQALNIEYENTSSSKELFRIRNNVEKCLTKNK